MIDANPQPFPVCLPFYWLSLTFPTECNGKLANKVHSTLIATWPKNNKSFKQIKHQQATGNRRLATGERRLTAAWRPIWRRSNNCAYHARNSSPTVATSSTNMRWQPLWRPLCPRPRPRPPSRHRPCTIGSGATLCAPLRRPATTTCPWWPRARCTTRCEAGRAIYTPYSIHKIVLKSSVSLVVVL